LRDSAAEVDVPIAELEPPLPLRRPPFRRPPFRRRIRAPRWQVAAGLAAALATVAGLSLLRGDRTDAGWIVDGGFEIRIAEGGVDVKGDPPAAFAGPIESAVRSGRLEIPESAAALRGGGGVLLAGEAQPEGPGPISPVGTSVLDARPLFRWRPVPGATAYRVTVADEALHTVASSPVLAGVEWRPDSALPVGRILTWQVAATTAGGTVLAPKPPAPEARFGVLGDAERARLEARLKLVDGSRLAAALAYLEAGLLELADRELHLLAREQRDPAAVERLRTSIKSAGGE
ncbi:MAG: hypothetical protein AAFY88_25430, partial [Acidobacteriota bacterium]